MGKATCPVCAEPFHHGVVALVVPGKLVPSVVCRSCARGGVVLVSREGGAGSPAMARYLRGIAEAYERRQGGSPERAAGIRQAADLVERGHVPELSGEKSLVLGRLEKADAPPAPKVLRMPPILETGKTESDRITARARAELAGAGEPPDAMARSLAIVLADAGAPLSRVALCIRAGYSPVSGSSGVAVAALRAIGFASGKGDALSPTIKLAEWRRANAARDGRMKIPDAKDLVTYWANHKRVGDMAGSILEILATDYPKELGAATIAEVAGYTGKSGSFGVALAKLVRLGLADRTRSKVYVASDALMGAASPALMQHQGVPR